MFVGLVKWFDCKKGFGFIVHEDGQDVFVHYTVIESDGFRRFRDGEQVEYEIMRGPKGLCASRARACGADTGRRNGRSVFRWGRGGCRITQGVSSQIAGDP